MSFRRNVARAIIASSFCASLALAGAVRAEMPTGQPVDGIRCDESEGAVFHIHQHLTIAERGRDVAIPDDIGRPIATPCLYWIHTHTPDGLIHIEAPAFRSFTLGNFFDVWGEPLSTRAAGPLRAKPGGLRVYVDGRRYLGDPRKIELAQHTDIAIEAGPPYARPAPFTNWQGQ